MKMAEIPIRRFQAGLALARDTYLYLPKNDKVIRIALAGEEISNELLERIIAKGHNHLRIEEDSEIDPESFPVHLQPPDRSPAPASEIPASAPAGPTHSPPEPETVLPTVVAVPEDIQKFSPDADITEKTRLAASEGEEESFRTIARSKENAESEEIFAKENPEDEPETRIRSEEEEEDIFEKKFTSERVAPPAIVRLQKRLQEPEDQGFSLNLAEEKRQALEEATTVILSSRVSEKIITLSERARTAAPDLRASLRGQIGSLKEALDQIESGQGKLDDHADADTKEEIFSVGETLSTATRAEQIVEVCERLSTLSLTKALAMDALEEQGDDERAPARNTASRDLPATVSRLAAYLGHSLGYTSVDFLADLSCGAIAYFTRKEGGTLDEELLPPLAKKLISTESESPDRAVIDSREVLLFLEAYIEDKECDRSHKDLLKRIFDRTVKQFEERETAPSAWSIKMWASFVNRGPTMDSHSICTRAAAKALKSARAAA